MDPLAIIELQRWGFPGVTKCRHRSIEFLTTQADQSKGDILIDYVLKNFSFNRNHLGIRLKCFIAGHNLTSAIIIQAIWFPARTG